jgi:hypothetical protein
MKRLLLVVVAGALLVPAAAQGQAPPAWCGGGSASCTNAVDGFSAALSNRFGKAWDHAKPKLESCPAGEAFGSTASCLAYFRFGATYRFVQGSITRSQDAGGTASYSSITTWRRRWRRCSLKTPSGSPGPATPGTLESNEPCDALPMEATYTVGDEMQGWEGSVHYEHEVGWQFTESAYFLKGMRPVELATCDDKNRVITCSDREGDSFRYSY